MRDTGRGGATKMQAHRSLVTPGLGADEAARTVLAALADRPGLVAHRVAPGRIAVARSQRPRWALVACALTIWLLGLGLLFLLVRRTEAADVLVVEGPRGAVVTIPPMLDGADGRALADALAGPRPDAAPEFPASSEPGPAPLPSQEGDLDAPTVRRPERAGGDERPAEPVGREE